MQFTSPRCFAATAALAVLAIVFMWHSRRSGDAVVAAPTSTSDSIENVSEDSSDELTMADVLQMAQEARENMALTLDDYTARFVKREMDLNGVLGEEQQMFVKVQTPLRGDTEDAPKRVYLNFQAPEALKGREVIWAEDMHEGQMAVHEVGLLLSLKTIWLDPNGMIAMRGQRFPITDIGLVRLVEKLIERGEQDRNNPDVSVTMTRDHQLEDVSTELIQVRRSKPSGEEGDFSLAEIIIDPERQLILRYRSFGWPENAGDDPPLLESYTYYDVKTNVGLTKADFDPKNPEYSYPAF